MRAWLCSLCAVVFLNLLAATVQAQTTVHHTPSGLQADVPKGWKVEKDKDDPNTVVATDPKEEVAIYFSVTEQDTLKEFLANLAEEVDDILTDVKPDGEPKAAKINGLEQSWIKGTAKAEGEKVEWELTLVLGGGSKSMVAVAVGDMSKYRKAIEEVYLTIKKK
jgi:predicted Zn-dependent protease